MKTVQEVIGKIYKWQINWQKDGQIMTNKVTNTIVTNEGIINVYCDAFEV